MNKLIIGSTAANYWYPEFRKPKDLDLMTEDPLMSKSEQHYWFGQSSEMILDLNKDSKYIDADLLLTLKTAHSGWDIHWQKTMYDILFLKNKGLKVNTELYKLLVKDFTRIHGKKWASLEGKDSNQFFEDAVIRKYNHDSIHEVIANYEKPLYFKILKEEGKVGCSETKFQDLSYQHKIEMIKEEVWVTALERYLIPEDFKYSCGLAYIKSLKKLATTMSTGWFKFFILDNYQNLVFDNDMSYIERFKKAQKENKIKINKK